MSKTRKYLIAGNWKMNIPSSDTKELVAGILSAVGSSAKVDVLVCPSFTSVAAAKDALVGATGVYLGAQNFYPAKSGAYTGEVSAIMLRELGVSHVLVGHSERRAYFHEDDAFLNQKVRFALANNLTPILCVGETIKQREAKQALAVIQTQITNGLAGVTTAEARKVAIAYEPVWAIGTGETATPAIAQDAHAFIRKLLAELFDTKTANAMRILYGGSMNAENAHELLQEKDIDGGLIGGASLKASSFGEIIQIARKLAG